MSVELLSKEFSRLMRVELTPEQLQYLNDNNKEETDPFICHSHDYLDANMVMDEAFTKVIGHECDLQSDSDISLLNQAWDMSKKLNFEN